MTDTDKLKKENHALLETLTREWDFEVSKKNENNKFKNACERLNNVEIKLLGRVFQETIEEDDLSELLEKGSLNKQMMAHALHYLYTQFTKTNNQLLLRLAIDVSSDPNNLEALRDTHIFWEEAMLKNKNLTSNHIQLLWDILKLSYIDFKKDAWGSPVRDYAKLRNCPCNVLIDLLEYDDNVVRKNVAYHNNSTDVIHKFFLQSKRKSERMLLAGSRSSSQQILLYLMKDKLKDIKSVARENFKFRFPKDYPLIKPSSISRAVKYFDNIQ